MFITFKSKSPKRSGMTDDSLSIRIQHIKNRQKKISGGCGIRDFPNKPEKKKCNLTGPNQAQKLSMDRYVIRKIQTEMGECPERRHFVLKRKKLG